jgi:hypothetical protein
MELSHQLDSLTNHDYVCQANLTTRRIVPTVPSSLEETLKRTMSDQEPVVALASTKELFGELAEWQGQLVSEALRAGATWDDIGSALGTTRQAAWARFRPVAEQLEGRSIPTPKEVKAVQQAIKDELRSLQDRLKSFDQKWRERHAELRQQTRELERQRAEERSALQHEIREAQAKLREEIRALRRPTP